jgi:hypothetical protein
MLARSDSAGLTGVEGYLVTVEADVALGLPGTRVVGQASGPVGETRDRVRAALRHLGRELPTRKQIVNLAPADRRKDSPGIDLAVASALLAAHEVVPPARLRDVILWGELALDGELRPAAGTLVVADCARREGFRAIAVPEAGAPEAALIPGIEVLPVKRLGDLVAHLRGDRALEPFDGEPRVLEPDEGPDMADVRGQDQGAQRRPAHPGAGPAPAAADPDAAPHRERGRSARGGQSAATRRGQPRPPRPPVPRRAARVSAGVPRRDARAPGGRGRGGVPAPAAGPDRGGVTIPGHATRSRRPISAAMAAVRGALDRFGPAHHDACMRTTLTLDEDVAQRLRDEAARQRKTFKEVVNEALRRGLEPARGARRRRYRVHPHKTTLRPGVDPEALNQLVDELEDEAVIAHARARQ